MAIEYETLTLDDFDAIVTGELNHYAIWLEDRLNDFLVSYLGILGDRKREFKRLFLYREGLKFQDKIDITTAILRERSKRVLRPGLVASDRWKTDLDRALKLLKGIETFKSVRNALAHGLVLANLKRRMFLHCMWRL